MTRRPTLDGPTARLSPRERFRAQTRAEIKEAALGQIAASGGAGNLSLNALAKSLGMAGPSLYRYFDSREALLTELLVDAFEDLAGSVEAAGAATTGGDGGSPEDGVGPDGHGHLVRRLQAYAAAYRSWALTHPELYELLFGTPVPGYSAPGGTTGPAAARGLLPLVDVVRSLRAAAAPSASTATAPEASHGPDPVPSSGVEPTGRWGEILVSVDADPDSFVAALGIWARLHGLLTLELRGHLEHMVVDPAALYDLEVRRAVTELGAVRDRRPTRRSRR